MKNKAKAINHFAKVSLTRYQQTRLRGGCCSDGGEIPPLPQTKNNNVVASTQVGS